MRASTIPRVLGCAILLLLCPLCLCAGPSSWTDATGKSFKGTPRGIFGPYALFDTGGGKSRHVLFRQLAPEDCLRFWQALDGKELLPAEDWSKASAQVSEDLAGRTLRLQKDILVPAVTKGVPEPELYVLIFASAWDGDSYRMGNLFMSTYERLRRLYGNRMEAVFFGVRHDEKGNATVARTIAMPWLVADYGRQESIRVFNRYVPREGSAMVLVSRDGSLLAYSTAGSVQAEKEFCDQLCAMMAAADETNRMFWEDRAQLGQAVRPVRFARGFAPPQMIGHLFGGGALRSKGVSEIKARLQVAADGSVSSVEIESPREAPGAIGAQLQKVLKEMTPFLPAIQDGKPVAAPYDFYVRIPEDSRVDLDRTWAFFAGRREIAIPEWLVLRPIPVSPESFGDVDHVTKEGVVVLEKMDIGTAAVSRKAQLNAFNSDFFGEAGPGGLQPVAGRSEIVDGRSYTWQKLASNGGWVEFAKSGADYSVGYAWAEFESEDAAVAYLGFGSDDGVKIWLNGVLVHDRWVRRPSRIDDDIIPLKLVAGKNRILIKIQNVKDEWGFIGRIRRL